MTVILMFLISVNNLILAQDPPAPELAKMYECGKNQSDKSLSTIIYSDDGYTFSGPESHGETLSLKKQDSFIPGMFNFTFESNDKNLLQLTLLVDGQKITMVLLPENGEVINKEYCKASDSSNFTI